MKCPANNYVIRRRDIVLKSHSKDRRSGRSILRSLDSWSSVLLLHYEWRMTCLLEREREREREREKIRERERLD